MLEYNLETLEQKLGAILTPANQNIPDSSNTNPISLDRSKISSTELMQKIRKAENWHTNMLQLVAHWVGRGWTDHEILATSSSLTLAGYTSEDTQNDMQVMIASGRKKWNKTSPEQTIDEKVSLIALSLDEFLARKIPPREMMLKPIIPTQGLVMLYAMRGIGKTYVSLSIALAVATGTGTLGDRWVADKPRSVLFVDGEMSAVSLQDRLKSMLQNLNKELPSPDYLRIITPDLQEQGVPDLSTDEGKQAIEEKLEGVDLLILDNLSSLSRQGKENDAESWMPIQGWLLSLRRRGVSVLIVHHAGKGQAQRGTSKKEDLLDTVIALKRPENYDPTHGAQFVVHYEKARGFYGDEAKPFDARLVDGMRWEVKNIEDMTAEQIKKLHAEGLTQREIAEEIKISASKVNRIIKALKEQLPPKEETQIPF